MTAGMFDSFITRHWFSTEAKHIWSDLQTLQAWLDVEAALAQAQARLGVIPVEVAEPIAAACRHERFDTDRLSRDIAHAQHPFVPVLRQLEEFAGEPAAGYIHWGATTQNIFDTGVALQMRRTHTLINTSLATANMALGELAVTHRDTLQAGRTHGQHALPMTFGFKVTGWLEEIRRNRQRLQDRIGPSFVASLGGAIGTFAAMGSQGPAVEAEMAAILGLEPAILPMRSSFDRATDYFCALALLAGTAEKIAQDIVFMQRTEIGEVEEAFHMGKVGSSTMAQKRNPSTALLLISLCGLLSARLPLMLGSMVRMDEGDSSATNVADVAVPEIAILGASVAETLARLVTGLVVHEDAMRRNIEITNGLIVSEAAMMQLSDRLGRHKAHHLLYEAAQRSVMEGLSFTQAIAEHPEMAGLDMVTLDTGAYTGDSAQLVDRLAR
ncbi:adenylosuccinate lyase family protein [Rhizobium rhizogenes]|uniref:Adenylosuccinate lyase family protein n=1 Tax=Rhizobium rhizogenes TaxID=359 RepID=A0AA92C189_RHIRH|nr:adenylosuccinate lyase family protein [Rhizobium rhizogenes]PVE52256.1 adenylosuccinate lyase family protein [Rhizobium rhizogenes]PVE62065.1 adenylosuccinate lyase family protein [Agrobacterium tumefaciens]PVE69847.1 adenylosuccinate lyase family protein [Sphingomonas sp. TPD3009]